MIRGQTTAQATPPTIHQMWETLHAPLLDDMGEHHFRSWIRPITPVSYDGTTLTLAIPTRFIRDWVKTHYADTISRLWRTAHGPVTRIDLVIDATISTPVINKQSNIANDTITAPATSCLASTLDARFQFDTFVVGDSNALAYAAAKKLADGDATVMTLNPLYIHGAVGLGKTHLLQATAAAMSARADAPNVLYLSAEKFMFQFVQALRLKDVQSFKNALRGVDVLLVDDIQFICGKESTQEEFIHTFNTLISLGKQIVVSADRSPLDLTDIDERLKSRLNGGLTVAITPPDAALRRAILEKKCALMNRTIAPDVLSFLADTVTASTRELEGALNRLIAQAELMNTPVTLETAKALLQDQIRQAARRLSVEDIQKKTAEYFNIRVADILSPRRARAVARPRQIAMYLAKTLTTLSLPDIGRKFDGRDHTTILHGIRKIEELIQTDADLRQAVDRLSRDLSA